MRPLSLRSPTLSQGDATSPSDGRTVSLRNKSNNVAGPTARGLFFRAPGRTNDGVVQLDLLTTTVPERTVTDPERTAFELQRVTVDQIIGVEGEQLSPEYRRSSSECPIHKAARAVTKLRFT